MIRSSSSPCSSIAHIENDDLRSDAACALEHLAACVSFDYAAIGSVTNLTSRLCDEAKAGHIVVSRRVYGMAEPWTEGKSLDELYLKDNHPVLAVEILRWRGEAEGIEAAVRRRQQPSRTDGTLRSHGGHLPISGSPA